MSLEIIGIESVSLLSFPSSLKLPLYELFFPRQCLNAFSGSILSVSRMKLPFQLFWIKASILPFPN
jgi:hypothetical protein